MRPSVRPLPCLAALLVGCTSVSLVRTEVGWREDGAVYSIAALPDGHLMPDGWRVDNFDWSGTALSRELLKLRRLRLDRSL